MRFNVLSIYDVPQFLFFCCREIVEFEHGLDFGYHSFLCLLRQWQRGRCHDRLFDVFTYYQSITRCGATPGSI